MNLTIKVWAFLESDRYDELIYSPRYAKLSACNELKTVNDMCASEYGVDYITLKWKEVSGAKKYSIYGVDKKIVCSLHVYLLSLKSYCLSKFPNILCNTQ